MINRERILAQEPAGRPSPPVGSAPPQCISFLLWVTRIPRATTCAPTEGRRAVGESRKTKRRDNPRRRGIQRGPTSRRQTLKTHEVVELGAARGDVSPNYIGPPHRDQPKSYPAGGSSSPRTRGRSPGPTIPRARAPAPTVRGHTEGTEPDRSRFTVEVSELSRGLPPAPVTSSTAPRIRGMLSPVWPGFGG